LRKGHHLENPGVEEDNIKIDLREVEWGSMVWIDLAMDRDRWRAFVNSVINLLVPRNEWNFLTI
jgi:hypothetical protein